VHRQAVLRVAGAEPGVVLDTHHHGDHVFGNALFAPRATIVAHVDARAEIAAAGHGLRTLWPDVPWGDLPLVLPDLTFRDARRCTWATSRSSCCTSGPRTPPTTSSPGSRTGACCSPATS
jgi:hypothetical protein